jgi:hypothetical protein
MVELVQSMFDLHKLASAGTDHYKTLLARRIEATDRQIDLGPALRPDGRGDWDCGGGEQVKESDENYFFSKSKTRMEKKND